MNLIQSLIAQAQQKKQQLYNDVSHIGAAPHPVQINTPQVQQAISTAKYGVLAKPQVAQQYSNFLNTAQQRAQPTIGTGLNNAMNAFNNSTAGLGKQALHFGTQAVGDVAATVAQHPVTPWTPAGGAAGRNYLYGQQTFKPVFGGGQNGLYDSTRNHLQASSNPILHNPLVAKTLAAGDVGLHVLNDVPVAGALVKGAVKGSAKLAPEVVKAAETLAPKAAPLLAKGAAGLQATADTIDQGALAATKAMSKNVRASYDKQGVVMANKATIGKLNLQKADLQQRIEKTPINNHVGAENVQRHIDQIDGQIASIKADSPKLTIKDRLLAPNIGLGTRPVHGSASVPEPPGEDLMNHFSQMRKEYGNDAEFFDKVVLENQSAPGMIGRLARSIARTDAVEGGKNYTISQILDDELTPIDKVAQSQSIKDAQLTDLKAMTRKLERDTGQKGLYTNAAKAMAGMNQDEQIAYLSKGMTSARDSGAMAAAHVNTENGYRPQPTTAPKGIEAPTTSAPPAKPAPVSPKPSAPRQLPPSKEAGGVSSGNGSKQRGFVTSVKASDEVSGKTKQLTTGRYNPRSTAKLQASAEQVASGDINKATQDVHSALDRKIGTINDKDVANSIAVAKAHDAAGNHQQSSDIYEKLAEHLTKQGQSIQAASLLSHQTPEGLQYGAQKALKKAGVELTPELQTRLKTAIDEVRNAKPGTDRDYAVKKLQKMVSDHTPTGVSDKLSSIWKAGLLTGVKTQTGNWLSNGTFQALHTVSNPLAVGIDKALSKSTGVRTKSLTGKGTFSGAREGIQKAGQFLKTGIDERTAIDNKYDTHGELNFKNKALNTYVNGVFRLMGAADRPTYYSQLRNSLHDLALTDAANKGISKDQLANHISEFLASPPTNAFQTATNEAEKAVLGNDTALSKIIGGVRQSVQRIDNPLARGTANAAVNFVAPFTKVPSAFLNRVIDFSPVGAVKEASMQLAAGKLDQRQLATALSEATTGTAIVYLGYQAAKHNLLSGNYPTGDAKEAQRWKADGIQPNSIKVGDKWLSLNYFGPLGLLFNAGQRVNDASKQGQNAAGQGIAAIAGAPKDLMGQSFLQGLSGFTNAINDPTRSAKTYLNSQGSSVVPTIVSDVATATDGMQRQADTLGQTIQSKLPGIRQGLRPKQDIYGNALQAKSGAANQLANPLRPSNDLSKTSPVLSEVNRLHTADPNNKDLQVTPTPVQKVVTVDKQKVNPTDKQRYDLQQQVGQATQDAWGKLIKTPEYQKLDDTGKAKALNNLRTDAGVLATRRYVTSNNLGTYSKAVSAKQGSLASGTNIGSYASNSGNSTGVTVSTKISPHSQKVLNEYNTLDAATKKSKAYNEKDYDYKVAQAKYDNAVANGTLSKAQLISQKDAVAKAKVGSSFTKDTRDYYGMSKQEVYNLITTDDNGKQIASDLLKYGDALQTATGTKNKFRSSKGAESFAPAAVSGSGRGTSLSTLLAGFKTPYSDMVKNSTKGSALARSAHLAKKKA